MNGRRRFLRDVGAGAAVGAGMPWMAAAAEPAREEALPTEGLECAGPMTVTRTGQTLSVLDRSRRRIVAIDPAEPTKRWTALGAAPPADEGATIAAIASLDSSTMLALWQADGEWSIRTHRVRPPGDEGAEATLQTVVLGRGEAPPPGSAPARPDIVISPSRDLFAVVGLPGPLPPILRGRITGVRLDAPSERRCPAVGQARLASLAFGPGDEWILLLEPADAPPPAAARLVWFATAGAPPLLDLDTGLPGIRDVAWDAETGRLFAVAGVAGSPTHPAGLYRLDSVLVDGRQTCRATCVARFADGQALVCLPRKRVVVSRTDGAGGLLQFTVPDLPVDAAGPGASPREGKR